MFNLPPISLYIHIPWCLKKCEYCDFNSHVSKNIIPEKKYIMHLLKDFENDIVFLNNRTIKTIFIGGGTPSLFNHVSIDMLIKEIRKRTMIKKNIEISIEANPKKLESQRFISYKNAGINRISLGIQTFNSILLKKIGRTYDQNEAIKSINKTKKININFNLDLMYGLPNQSLEDALLDLYYAISYNPNHISWYQFTIEPNTIFYKKKLEMPSEDIIMKMLIKGNQLLKKSGYKKYEISSYSKKNYQCAHNLNYWNFGDYIGIGCGAHGKITQHDGTIIRTVKNNNPFDFMNGNYLNKTSKIDKNDIAFEYFMNLFRLCKPISKKHFHKRTNLHEKNIKKNISIAIKKGYLIDTLEHWHTTRKGKMFLNSLLELFLH